MNRAARDDVKSHTFRPASLRNSVEESSKAFLDEATCVLSVTASFDIHAYFPGH